MASLISGLLAVVIADATDPVVVVDVESAMPSRKAAVEAETVGPLGSTKAKLPTSSRQCSWKHVALSTRNTSAWLPLPAVALPSAALVKASTISSSPSLFMSPDTIRKLCFIHVCRVMCHVASAAMAVAGRARCVVVPWGGC